MQTMQTELSSFKHFSFIHCAVRSVCAFHHRKSRLCILGKLASTEDQGQTNHVSVTLTYDLNT